MITVSTFTKSIGKSQFFVDKVHQPCWSDHQKLHILEEGWFFSFDFMSIKLKNPSQNKN